MMDWLFPNDDPLAKWLFAHGFTRGELIAVELLVILALVGWLAWEVRKKQRTRAAWLAIYATDKPLQKWKTDQGWRKPTGIPFLEQLKTALDSDEKYLIKGKEAALNYQSRCAVLQRGGAYLKRVWLEIGTPSYDPNVITWGQTRCEQLERLWGGDTYAETAERKLWIEGWRRRRADAQPENKAELRTCDQNILQIEVELDALVEIKRRAQERASVSPHEAKLRDAREIHVTDVHHDMTKAFLGVLSQMEIFRKRAELKQQVTNDPNFTNDEKERLFAKIEELAAAADSKAVPARQSKPGSIYKEDRG